jgi:hypothetical protein
MAHPLTIGARVLLEHFVSTPSPLEESIMALSYRPPVTASRSDPEICRRIEAEFREMPGLTLTLPQASLLFGVEPARCGRLLLGLVREGLLATDGRSFARADCAGSVTRNRGVP